MKSVAQSCGILNDVTLADSYSLNSFEIHNSDLGEFSDSMKLPKWRNTKFEYFVDCN